MQIKMRESELPILENNVKFVKDTLSFDNTEIAFAYKSDKELKRSFLLFKVINQNLLVKIGPKLALLALKLRLPIESLIKESLFKQFCGGETIDESMNTIKLLGQFHIGSILDYSIEGEEREDVFDQTTLEIIRTIKRASENKDIPFAVFKISGLGKSDLIESAFTQSGKDACKTVALTRTKERVNEICKAAYHHNVPVMIDAEESWLQPFIDKVCITMMEKYNTERAIVINTYQMYRKDRLDTLQEDIHYSKSKGFYLGVKLVRGAYMEKERDRALSGNYTSPIHENKKDTDNHFNKALELCLKDIDTISLIAGTHNLESCYYLASLIEEKNLSRNHPHIYFSQLLGMSDPISFNLGKAGFNVAKYVPYGPVRSVLPYLFRRAEENTAISGQMGRELRLLLKEIQRRQKVDKKK